jgi:hypothetical protein
MIRVVSMQQMMSAKRKRENSVDRHFTGIKEVKFKVETSKMGQRFTELTD